MTRQATDLSEQIIVCPQCEYEIKLTESLAGPLIESMRADYEARLKKMDVEVKRHETALRQREAALQEREDTFEERIGERVRAEREKIAAEESKKARRALADDLADKSKELSELQELLQQRETKLEEAQKAQAEFMRKQRELEDARREMEVAIEKRVQEGLDAAREQAKKEADEQLRMRLSEKELTIDALQKRIEELKRRAEKGSEQLRGEAQELELETLLAEKFPTDEIAPVPKGEHGGDVLQTVPGPLGRPAGSILWESKRTKNWSDGWLGKLKDDQRAAKADLAVIVSVALPKDVESFDYKDGVWVVEPRAAMPVAVSLRHMLLEVSLARKASEGQQSKMEEMYQYLTGPMFRQRVQVLVETFTTMQEDSAKEKKVFQKQWAKREKELERVLIATAGMYGDLQGIAGKSIQEIEGLSLASLEYDGSGDD